MATIYRKGHRWRAQVYVGGQRESGVFDTKAEASAWAVSREAQLSGKKLPDKTMGDAMARYSSDVSPEKGGARWEMLRLGAMQRDPLASRPLAALEASDIAGFRDRRLKTVSAATVLRELNLLRSVIESARRDWGWIRSNPMRDVRKPKAPPSRKRRVSEDEIDRVSMACGLADSLAAETALQRVGLAFLFGIETACRAGEMVAMRPEEVHLKERYVHLPTTKNGEARDVPLSKRAREILELLLSRNTETVFDLHGPSRDVLFRRVTKAAQLVDLHFHDSRAEAIWRLSKKFDVLQLARVIGHRDLKSLMLYYNESASELAMRLD